MFRGAPGDPQVWRLAVCGEYFEAWINVSAVVGSGVLHSGSHVERCVSQPIVRWLSEKDRKKAIVPSARKLLVSMYHMLD